VSKARNTMAYDYVKAFTEGHSYNKIVAQKLIDNGIPCSVPELQIAKNSQERRNLTLTETDITLDLIPHILEVKNVSIDFGWDPKDFPYPTTIVDTVNSYEDKEIKPAAYILRSKKTGAMLTVGPSSKNRWKQKTLFDKKQQLTDNFYIVNKADLKTFNDLVKYLVNLQNAYQNNQ
jgi:hypothetical protein